MHRANAGAGARMISFAGCSSDRLAGSGAGRGLLQAAVFDRGVLRRRTSLLLLFGGAAAGTTWRRLLGDEAVAVELLVEKCS